MVLAAVSHSVVVVAITGAAGALAGFVLVFLGILVSSYQSLVGQVSREKVEAFRRASRASLGVFLLGLTCVALSTVWLVASGGTAFYVVAVVLFFAELAALIFLAVFATSRALR